MKAIFSTFPSLKRLAVPLRQPAEAALVEFGRAPRVGDPSVLFFTTQKCASTFIPHAFRAVGHRNRLLDLAGYLIHTRSEDVYEYMTRRSASLFKPVGAIYAPLRDWIDIDALEKYRIILMLRDPRDVLVSNYYSLARSHPLPGSRAHRQEMMARRRRALHQSVDEYVLENRDRFIDRFRRYHAELMGRMNVTFLTYESMVTDFDGWASSFLQALDVQADESVLTRLRAARGTDPSAAGTEDASNHRRSGAIGQFREKLARPTRETLGESFADVLEAYGVWEA